VHAHTEYTHADYRTLNAARLLRHLATVWPDALCANNNCMHVLTTIVRGGSDVRLLIDVLDAFAALLMAEVREMLILTTAIL
jgi:hypothetical protein